MIEEGNVAVLQSGEKTIVEDIDKVVYDEPITVYNFEVENFHTYFVSDASVIAHNKSGSCEELSNEMKATLRKFIIDGEWIEERYCCFSAKEYATWIYKFKNSIYLMVTRVFREFGEDDIEEKYSIFINQCLTVFSTKISYADLENFFQLLTCLKAKL